VWKKGYPGIQSAIRLLKVYPGDFDMLGIKCLDEYYIDKCMPMGCSILCSRFEKLFYIWAVELEAKSKQLDHCLDDFLFVVAESNDCLNIMNAFSNVCNKLGVPIADKKRWVLVQR